MRYALSRLRFYALAAWAAITINFFLPRLMPGDPAALLVARFRGRLSPESVVALREAFGVGDGPLYKQYAAYIAHAVRGDFGRSTSYFPARVVDVIGPSVVWTLGLTGTAVVLSFVIGTVLGIFAGAKPRGVVDTLVVPLFALIGSFPYFWLAMLVLFVFGRTLGWFPLRHAYGSDIEPGLRLDFVLDVLRHAVLPAMTIIAATLGGWIVGMRNAMLVVLGSDAIKLARAKGLPARTVLFRYAARNALVPNVTEFGMALGFVLSGSLLTEIVFSYPGQGYLLVQAVRNHDYPLIQGIFLFITFAVLLANWMIDIVVARIDPRAQRHA